MRKSIAEIGHLEPGDVLYMSPSNEVLAHLPYMVALHRRAPLAAQHLAARRAWKQSTARLPSATHPRSHEPGTLCSPAHIFVLPFVSP